MHWPATHAGVLPGSHGQPLSLLQPSWLPSLQAAPPNASTSAKLAAARADRRRRAPVNVTASSRRVAAEVAPPPTAAQPPLLARSAPTDARSSNAWLWFPW